METSRIQKLEENVRALYETKSPDRADWTDWLYENYVFVVADYSQQVAENFGGNPELARAAGMLHDIADAVMKRDDPSHEVRSVEIARQLLSEGGFSEDEIRIVVDDAIRFHACHGDEQPQTLEGKAMATGDGLGHIATNFYDYGLTNMKARGDSLEQIRTWALPKIERDYREKIQYDEIREETKVDYERVKTLFA